MTIFPKFVKSAIISEKLRSAIAAGIHQIGEIEIQSFDSNSRFKLCHVADVDGHEGSGGEDLTIYQGPGGAREIALEGADGSNRFLKAQENLRRGWVMLLDTVEDLRLALDQFYPACVGLWLAEQEGTLEVEHLRDKLRRQSGMYQRVRVLSDEALQKLVGQTCSSVVPCARRLMWQLDANTPLLPSAASCRSGIPDGTPAGEAIPLLCREACNHFVAECLAASKAAASPASGHSRPA